MYYHANIGPFIPRASPSSSNHHLFFLCLGGLLFLLGAFFGAIFMYIGVTANQQALTTMTNPYAQATTQESPIAGSSGQTIIQNQDPNMFIQQAIETAQKVGTTNSLPIQTMQSNPIANIAELSAHAITESRDLKRKNDLNTIHVALSILIMETNIYNTLPRASTKIGTLPGMFNLAKYTTPDYLDTFPKDPVDGTDEDTKYSLYVNTEGKIVLQATSEENPAVPIEVVR